MQAGVDEAGRGPVLGPLVVAAIRIQDDQSLRELGVRDSKLLSPAKREELAPDIRRLADRVETRIITAAELNTRMPTENLNQIEEAAFAELLDRLTPTTAWLDACDANAERFGRNVHARLHTPCQIHSEHQADARHPVVAAASIIAKTERDRLMRELSDTHGPTGSGYASDPTTKTWLRDHFDTHHKLPDIARHQWETCRRLLQRDLTAWLGTPPAGQTATRAKPKNRTPRSGKQ